MVRLSLPAIRQILLSSGVSSEQEKLLIRRVEKSALRYDHSNNGELTIKEWFNVIKIQNHIDTSLEMVKNVCEHLPATRKGKIKIKDFLHLPILSEEAFRAIDRNKDGFITLGELKLANKDFSIRDISKKIDDHDIDEDRKLNLSEYKSSIT